MQTVFSSAESFLPFGGLVRPPGILASFGPSWSNTGDWSVANDELVGNSTSGFYYTSVPLVAGTTYVMRLYLRDITAGSVALLFNSDPTTLFADAAGVVEATFTATGTDTLNVKGYGGFTGHIGWIQISAT